MVTQAVVALLAVVLTQVLIRAGVMVLQLPQQAQEGGVLLRQLMRVGARVTKEILLLMKEIHRQLLS